MTEIQPSLPNGGGARRFNLGLTDARWIAAATIVGYGITYAYDSGFLGAFGVPTWVIRPDLPHVLSALAGFSFAGMTVWGVAHALPSRPYWTLIPLITGLGAAATMVAFVIRFTNWTLGWGLILPIVLLFFAGVLGLASVLEVIQVMGRFDQIPSRWDRLRKSFVESKFKNPVDAVEKILIADPTGRRMSWYATLLVLLLATLAARSCGAFNAKRLNVVAFRAAPVPCIVIQHYGDQLVCVSIDTTTHTVGKSFSLIPANDATLLEERSFWPLRFPEEEKVFVLGPGAFSKPEPARGPK